MLIDHAFTDQIGDPAESRKVSVVGFYRLMVSLIRFSIVILAQGIAALYEYRKVHPEANPRIAQW